MPSGELVFDSDEGVVYFQEWDVGDREMISVTDFLAFAQLVREAVRISAPGPSPESGKGTRRGPST